MSKRGGNSKGGFVPKRRKEEEEDDEYDLFADDDLLLGKNKRIPGAKAKASSAAAASAKAAAAAAELPKFLTFRGISGVSRKMRVAHNAPGGIHCIPVGGGGRSKQGPSQIGSVVGLKKFLASAAGLNGEQVDGKIEQCMEDCEELIEPDSSNNEDAADDDKVGCFCCFAPKMHFDLALEQAEKMDLGVAKATFKKSDDCTVCLGTLTAGRSNLIKDAAGDGGDDSDEDDEFESIDEDISPTEDKTVVRGECGHAFHLFIRRASGNAHRSVIGNNDKLALLVAYVCVRLGEGGLQARHRPCKPRQHTHQWH